MNIEINKGKKRSTLKSCFNFLMTWFILCSSFYFNYKFIDGNNFLDFMIFFIAVTFLIGICQKFPLTYKKYNDVSDEKIKEIELILNK